MKSYVTLLLLLFSAQAWALAPCSYWSGRELLTNLNAEIFPEVSGLAASKRFPGRYYLANDSGHNGVFYSLDLPSGRLQKIEIKGFKGWDIEALSVGPCGSSDHCLYIGDIGDNSEKRDFVRVAAVEEREIYPSAVRPVFHTQLTYPDRPQNSEGMIVTDEGELFIFSKEEGIFSTTPTRIYSIEQKDLKRSGKRRALVKRGEFEIQGFMAALTVTDAALSPDGQSLFFLGYFSAFEVPFEEFLLQAQGAESKFSLPGWSFSAGYAYQNEAATYAVDSDAILWTYESKKQDAPLFSRSCVR